MTELFVGREKKTSSFPPRKATLTQKEQGLAQHSSIFNILKNSVELSSGVYFYFLVLFHFTQHVMNISCFLYRHSLFVSVHSSYSSTQSQISTLIHVQTQSMRSENHSSPVEFRWKVSTKPPGQLQTSMAEILRLPTEGVTEGHSLVFRSAAPCSGTTVTSMSESLPRHSSLGDWTIVLPGSCTLHMWEVTLWTNTGDSDGVVWPPMQCVVSIHTSQACLYETWIEGHLSRTDQVHSWPQNLIWTRFTTDSMSEKDRAGTRAAQHGLSVTFPKDEPEISD